MLKNYFILAVRNLLKRRLYSFINICGLAIGVAVCLIILKYIEFELSYDNYHENADHVYRTTTAYYQSDEFIVRNILSGYAQGPSLLADVPEIKTYVRTHRMYNGAVLSYNRDSGDPSTFYEDGIQFVDSTYFDVFAHKAVQGDLRVALDRPSSIVLTRKMAEKYFHKGEEPLGKVLKVSGGWADGDYEVTAVIDDVPQNTHFRFDILIPTHNLLRNNQYVYDDGWGWNNFVTYVEMHPQTDMRKVDEKMPAFIEKYQGKGLAESNSKAVLTFQPIREIHTSPGLGHETSETMGMNTIYFFILISVFILAIAWVNYINLSTARAMERSREVGIKKSIGAYKSQLIFQFIFESVLVNFLGVVIAVALATAMLPALNEIVGKELSFDFTDTRLWAIFAVLFLTGSLISGGYPAFVLSSFNTIDVLKGKSEKMIGGFSLRKALVVFQFASSLILIAGTFTIYRQIFFMRDQDKGLTMDQMLIINGPRVVEREVVRERLVSFKNELKKIPGVTDVATSGAIPGGGYNWGTSIRKDGTEKESEKFGSIVWVDPDFVDTYNITIVAGRNFNPAIKSDMESVLVNEAALTTFGLGTAEEALNERVILGGDTVAILGVLKNYHWNSLKTEHSPWLLKADTISSRNYSIHLSGSHIDEAIAQVEAKYKAIFPGNPFDYFFLDEFFNYQYSSDRKFGEIFSMFAVLAIIIACLGLWGLAAFNTTQRLKEIGIRKVLGATISSLMSLLSWQFFKLILFASLIALPITWYGIDTWLDNFAFRIGLQWDLFVVPVFILIILALGTVSVQILRGASINPAKVLRSE